MIPDDKPKPKDTWKAMGLLTGATLLGFPIAWVLGLAIGWIAFVLLSKN